MLQHTLLNYKKGGPWFWRDCIKLQSRVQAACLTQDLEVVPLQKALLLIFSIGRIFYYVFQTIVFVNNGGIGML